MDLASKIRLMKRYDFSQHAEGKEASYLGFRGQYMIIGSVCRALMNHEEDNGKDRQRLFAAYGYLRARYDEIDFAELERVIDTEDREDFSTLFKTREFLPQLGRALYLFSQHPNPQNYEKLKKIVENLQDADTPSYRNRIRKLEESLG